MKNLILLSLLLFTLCDRSNPSEPVMVDFNAIAGGKAIENQEVKIYNGNTLITFGKLPLGITSYTGETLTAKFDVYVTNFPTNHPQCDCEEVSYTHFKCTEDHVVDGNDWEVAK